MEFIIGAIGALVILALLFGGVVIGWKLKAYEVQHTQRVTAETLTESQKKMIRDQQEAWQQIHDYNVETAYGLNRHRPESEG